MYLNVRKINTGLTVLATLGAVAACGGVITLIVFAVKGCCPFLYSWDGENYVFDAEPLGGAITKGLERQEYSRLDHMEQADGKYHLLVKNEVNETQYLDEISLLVFDHSRNSEIITDQKGNFYEVSNALPPLSVTDENGNSLLPFVKASDNICWQTGMPVDSTLLRTAARHNITMKFRKPAEAAKANLIVHGGTTLLGSYMIRLMTQMRGTSVNDWYKKIDERKDEYYQMLYFLEREELYNLKVHALKGKETVIIGSITGGGPLMTETAVVPLDVSECKGDTLTLIIEPPFGFWTLDRLAIEYDDLKAPAPIEVSASSASDNRGSVLDLLIRKDDNYNVMPIVGVFFKMEFNAPPEKPGTKRTIFSRTTGYYKLHLEENTPDRTAELFFYGMNPGYIVREAVKTFNAMQQISLSGKETQ